MAIQIIVCGEDMRRIVFLTLNDQAPGLYERCLEICSAYTPLVEPSGNNAIFLDLSGCGATGGIIREISQRVGKEMNPNAKTVPGLQIGLAASKLLAHCAVKCMDSVPCPPETYRLITWPEARVITIIPGQERSFIANLPLNSFYPLRSDLIKRLTRLGFSRVGELSALPLHQLSLLSPKDGILLAQLVRGEDSSPVTGLYPPFHISYPIGLEEAGLDFTRIENALREAAGYLTDALESRHYGCSHISLDLISGLQRLRVERSLSSDCSRPEHLSNILLGLMKQAGPLTVLSGLIITLDELAPRQMLQPDIFSYRATCEKEQRQDKVRELITNLTDRFPDSLKSGLQLDRREQVLSYWDPWRTGVN